MSARMHADEVVTDVELVRRLLRDQLPAWADLPVQPVPSSGTDHAIYRLGDDLAVRMPRIGWAAGQAAHERTWLPRLAEHLPVRLPEQVGAGEPGHGYPFAWSVVTWVAGSPAGVPMDDDVVDDLVAFVRALRDVEVPDAPARRPAQRGGLLEAHDPGVRRAVEELGDRVDGRRVLSVWDDARAAQPPEGVVPSHGDLLPGNLLVDDGRLSAVIDWGGFGLADPALDLLPAWNAIGDEGRARLREGLGVDDDAWARSRGWALQQAVLALPYYWDTNPGMVAQASYALEELLSPSSRPW